MKNILKKIGVIGIIIAMLAPFVEMPVAKAATQTCSDHTLQQYYFLDVFNATGIQDYIDGRTTATMFADLFPTVEAGKNINIINVGLENLESKESLTDYWNEMTHLGGDYTYEKKSTIGKVGNYQTSSTSDVEYYTSILHGLWGECTTSECEATKLDKTAGWYNGSASEFYKSTIQYLLKYDLSSESVSLKGGRFNGTSKLTGVNSSKYSGLKNYFDAVANNKDSELISKYDGNDYLGIQITREFFASQYNDLTYGRDCVLGEEECDGKKYRKFNSIDDFFNNNLANSTTTDTKPNVLSSDTFYWPVILNVEYEVCTNTSEQWTLKYDGNTDDNSANNIPEKVQKSVGEYVEIDSKTPTRNGYTFKGWNTEKDGSGKTYNAGDKYESPDSADVRVLYAQWGNASKGEQKPTGVASYIIGFISVGIVAGGIYLIAKKKNLFKQI